MDEDTLGNTIRRARTAKGAGLRELARDLTITPSYLSDIENDRRVPAEEVLRQIAAALDLSLDNLMGLAGRFGEQAERYLRREPNAARLFRRISEANLPPEDIQQLLDRADQLVAKKRQKT